MAQSDHFDARTQAGVLADIAGGDSAMATPMSCTAPAATAHQRRAFLATFA
jgi:hypothetical protein